MRAGKTIERFTAEAPRTLRKNLCDLCGSAAKHFYFLPSASGFSTLFGLPAAKLTMSSTTTA